MPGTGSALTPPILLDESLPYGAQLENPMDGTPIENLVFVNPVDGTPFTYQDMVDAGSFIWVVG